MSQVRYIQKARMNLKDMKDLFSLGEGIHQGIFHGEHDMGAVHEDMNECLLCRTGRERTGVVI